MAKYKSRRTGANNTSENYKGSNKMFTINLTKNVENPVTGKKVERKATVKLPAIVAVGDSPIEGTTTDGSEAVNRMIALCGGDALLAVKWYEHGVRAHAKQVAANSLLLFGDAETKKALREFSNNVQITADVMEVTLDEARKILASKPKFAEMAAKVAAFEVALATNTASEFDYTDLSKLKQPKWFGGDEEDEENGEETPAESAKS